MNEEASTTLLCILDTIDERLSHMEFIAAGMANAAGFTDGVQAIEELQADYRSYRSDLEMHLS